MPRLYSLIVKPSENAPFVPPAEGEIWHLRHAALAAEGSDKDSASLTFKTSDSSKVSLGTLRRDRVDFMTLDLPLTEYVEFSVKGTAAIHLTGILIPEEEGMDFAVDDEDEDLEMMKDLMLNGRSSNAIKAAEEGDSEDSEDEEEEEPEPLVQIEDITEKAKPIVKDLDKREEAPMETPMSKSAAKKLKRKQKKEAEKAKKDAEKEAEKSKKEAEESKIEPVSKKQKLNSEASAPAPKKKKIRRFSNGYVIETLKEGNESGPGVSTGSKVTIKYIGRLEDGKVFDQTRGDKFFTFKYATGEVIKGLDKGLDDMKVGEKRRLTVPAKMGYGAIGAEPAVPPNAQLSFDIELMKITL